MQGGAYADMAFSAYRTDDESQAYLARPLATVSQEGRAQLYTLEDTSAMSSGYLSTSD